MKKLRWILVAAVVLAGIYFIGSGFLKSPSVYLSDYTVSEDGTQMTIRLGVASSAGYVRKVAVQPQPDGTLRLDCYAAFGGINGSIGARSDYTIPLSEDARHIALFRSDGCYEEILQKADDGSWQRVR